MEARFFGTQQDRDNSMLFKDEQEGVAPRMNDEGNLVRVPVSSKEPQVYSREERLEMKPKKLSQENRDVINDFCKHNNCMNMHTYLINEAERRAHNDAKLFAERKAARGEPKKRERKVTEEDLRDWLRQREHPTLFE